MNQVAIVFFVPFDVFTRMNSPHEVHTVLLAGRYQLTDILRFLVGIGLAPVGTAVVGVVLRTIHIHVHFMLAIEVDERQAHLVRPWVAVKSFYHTTKRQVGPVVHGEIRQRLSLESFGTGNVAKCL